MRYVKWYWACAMGNVQYVKGYWACAMGKDSQRRVRYVKGYWACAMGKDIPGLSYSLAMFSIFRVIYVLYTLTW